MMPVDSKVISATVYSDRAVVVRGATIKSEKGENTFIFDHLPESTEPESLQVEGTGGGQLLDVKFRKVFHSSQPDDLIRNFHEELELIHEKEVEINDAIEHAKKEKAFIESIASKLTAVNEDSSDTQLDPERWVKMVAFYREKMESLDREIRKAVKEQKKIKREKEIIAMKISGAGPRDEHRNRAEVVMLVKDDAEFEIRISYLVYGPAWKPFYDLRVNSSDKSMNVAFRALVRQNTGENWNDIDLSLSTARPNISGIQPELKPWFLSEYVPPRPRAYESRRMEANAEESFDDMSDLEEEEDIIRPAASMSQMFPVPPAAPEIKPYQSDAAEVESHAASVIFKISDRVTIENDNQDHKTTIMIYNFNAGFRYSAVPRLSPHAYLKATSVNNTEYPFLPGNTNVFLDNNFVSNSHLDFISPGEEFRVYLGIDESMKVEYKLLQREKKEAGMFSKTIQYLYNYQIEITNTKKTEEEIAVWDQLPISNNEKIQVKLISPQYREDSENLKMNEYKYLEWLYSLKPGEKKIIPFKFSVEYPSDMAVIGL